MLEPLATALLTLGATGAGAAAIRYLWRRASGGATEARCPPAPQPAITSGTPATSGKRR